jgi:hypothetical protein
LPRVGRVGACRPESQQEKSRRLSQWEDHSEMMSVWPQAGKLRGASEARSC